MTELSKPAWARAMIALYQRSPKDADGWANVSSLLEYMLREREGLFVLETMPDGTVRARLTDAGKIVAEWV